MKAFFVLVFLCCLLCFSRGHAEIFDPPSNCPAKELAPAKEDSSKETPSADEDDDPLEPFNRGIFWLNVGLDTILIEPLTGLYKNYVPTFFQERIGFVLRNLNEPIVFGNYLLQGEADNAMLALERFIVNSTVGFGGLFDVSGEWEIPYKKTDFGLTLASWGVGPGFYLMLPLLGPSNMRDALGRVGDFIMDPITWIAIPVHAHSRTSVQILDAKTDSLNITEELKKSSLEYYDTLRIWYTESRKAKAQKGELQTVDTPRPDAED